MPFPPLDTALERLNGTIGALDDPLEDMDGAVEDLNGTFDNLTGAVESLNSRIAELNEAIDELDGDLDALDGAVAEALDLLDHEETSDPESESDSVPEALHTTPEMIEDVDASRSRWHDQAHPAATASITATMQ